MSVPIGRGKPTAPGTYIAEIYFGWKLLDWDGSVWWHQGKVGHWGAGDPLQWVGPLPKRIGAEEQWYMKAHGTPTATEYDL